MQDDQFRYWQDELRRIADGGEPVDPRRGTSHDLSISGYWRISAARTKEDWPVAIFKSDGVWWQQWGPGKIKVMTDVEAAEFRNGSFLHAIAVRKPEFEAAASSGKWPSDGKASRPQTAEQKAGIDVIPTTPASEGGNAPEGEDGDDFHQQISDKIAKALEDAEGLPKVINSQEDAEKAAAIRDAILSAGKLGEARRKEEKQPHLDAANAVDNKWRFLQPASNLAKSLLGMIDGFQSREQARKQREQREVEAAERKRLADIEAERLRQEAAERAEQAERMGMTEIETPSEDDIAARAQEIAAEQVPTVEVAKPVVRGSEFGRAATKAKVIRAEIIDVRALCEHFIHTADADFHDYLSKRAASAARAKITLPGTKRVEE